MLRVEKQQDYQNLQGRTTYCKNLLGKAENPMSTLVEGTANLSSQVDITNG